VPTPAAEALGDAAAASGNEGRPAEHVPTREGGKVG
jgi:hypothetical protein